MKTFASLFTGGGLADIGAMQAGYTLLWGIELDPEIAAVANANLPHRDTVYAASVIGFDWASLERPDHLHISPPCQDFSVAKTSGKVSNPNNEIADACIEALWALEPSTVTLENVEGYRKAPGFQRIVDYLWGAGYWVNVDVLNAADFGVPQTRRRLFLRAVRGGFPQPLPQPVKWRGWYEAIEDLISTLPETQFAAWQLERLPDEMKKSFLVPGGNSSSFSTREGDEPSRTVESTNRVGNIPRAYLVHPTDQRTMPAVEASAPSFTQTTHQGGNTVKALLVNSAFPGSNGKKHYTRDEPSFTTDTTALRRMKASIPSGRVVRMTPRCLARFQSVPDWYALPEKAALACKIIGNGIPCLMMRKIISTLKPES